MLTKEFLKRAEDELNKKYHVEIVVESYNDGEYIGEKRISQKFYKGETFQIVIGGLHAVGDEGVSVCGCIQPTKKWWEFWK